MRKKVDENILLNEWLIVFHGVDIEEVKKAHPEWEKEPERHSRDFFIAYAVTNEEYNEWEEWAKKYIKKITRYPMKYIDRQFCWVALQIGPIIKKEDRKKLKQRRKQAIKLKKQ